MLAKAFGRIFSYPNWHPISFQFSAFSLYCSLPTLRTVLLYILRLDTWREQSNGKIKTNYIYKLS